MPRLLRASVAIAVVMVAAPLTPANARGGDAIGDDLLACKASGVRLVDGWARIPSPTYRAEDGAPDIKASAAPADKPRRIYVTNGTAVRMTDDAGCKWEYIYPPTSGNVPMPRLGHDVTDLDAPSDNSLWLTMYEGGADAPRPHVLMTRDATYAPGNRTKEPLGYLDDGLPAVGLPVDLEADGGGENAFLLMDEPHDVDGGKPLDTIRHLYRLAEDATLEPATGSRRLLWSRVTTLPEGFGRIEGIAKPRRQPSGLWVWSGKRWAFTNDGGVKWEQGTAAGPITAIDTNIATMTAIFTKHADGGRMELRDSTGRVRQRMVTPIAASHVVHGGFATTWAIAGEKRVFGFDDVTARWIELTPKGVPAFTDLHMGAKKTGRIMLGETKDALYRFDLFSPEAFVKHKAGTPRPGPDTWVPVSGLLAPELTPERQTVTVRPGQRVTAPVELKVPPTPSTIDVFFLIDTTLSMTKAIQGLREGVERIAREVTTRTRGQACFGLGEVKDFSLTDNPWHGKDAVTAYELKQPIDCEDQKLTRLHESLRKLHEGGGDRFPEEAQALALKEAVEGDGHVTPPVTAGQDAKFRSPTRVIVLITDVGFKVGPIHAGYPTIEETIQTLNAFNTKVVGIGVKTERNDVNSALADMRDVARGTKTLASPDGVDCDGDGLVGGPNDLAGGAPIVCRADNYAPAIAPAIVGVLLAVEEPGGLAIHAQDPHSVVVDVAGAVGKRAAAPDVVRTATKKAVSTIANMRVENKLTFKPVVTCAKEQDGMDLLVRLDGVVRDSVVDDATILVRCRAKPVDLIKPPPVPPVIDPIFVLPKPQPAPVAVPQFQPPPPNNPPGNLNMNAGLSQEEEQQFQLAGVTQGATDADQEAEDVELAMSGLGEGDAAAATMLFGCAIGMSIMAGGVLAHRRRTQLRPAQARARF